MKYDESIKVYRDRLAVMEFERQKGLAEGLEKGMQKGLQKGKEEEKKEIARNLKQTGIAPEIIAQATGLTIEAIARL